MAIQKNSNNNNNNNENSGFKTAAFGFDKNDVTMYIASLRKKMKAMEEEYEERIAQMEREGGYVPPAASHNEDDNVAPASTSSESGGNVSADQLEAIRAAASDFYSKKVEDAKAENKELQAELDGIKDAHAKEIEKIKEEYEAKIEKTKRELTEKLESSQKELSGKLEKSQKDQFAQIDKITRQLEAAQRENESLREQVNAYSKVGMQNNELAENTIRTIGDALVNAEKIKENAKQLASFSALAKTIAESTEQFGELLKKQEENAKQLEKIATYASAVSINTDQITDMLGTQKARLEGETSGPAYSMPKAVDVMPSYSAMEEEETDDINVTFNVEEDVSGKKAEKSKPDIDDITAPFGAEGETKTDLKSQPVVEHDSNFDSLADLMAEEVTVEPASVKPDADIDFSDLLADDADDETDDIVIEELDKKADDKGDDLGDDLYEIIIDHDDQPKKADLGVMLDEQKHRDIEENKRVQIQPAQVDDDLASLIAAAEAAAVPDMDERISKAAKKQEEVMIEAENSVKPLNSENDVFNFAFDDGGSDDDDDMSTDNFDFSSMM